MFCNMFAIKLQEMYVTSVDYQTIITFATEIFPDLQETVLV